MRGGWPLTGRAEELRLIDAALNGPAGTAGVAIAGRAGVGKSRLAREALAVAASHGYAARWAVGTTSAREVPLGAFAEWAGGLAADPLQLVRGVIGALTEGMPATKVVVAVDDAICSTICPRSSCISWCSGDWLP